MKQEATPRRDQYSLLSRLMLTSSSDFWTFHAAWFRFVDGAVEAQKKTIHTHMFYELHYVLEGRLSIQLPDDRRFVASAGEFVLLPPRTPHLVADEAPPSRKLVCGFSVQSAQPQLLRSLQAVQGGLCCAESDTLRQLTLALRTKLSAAGGGASPMALLLVQALVLEMLEIAHPFEGESVLRLKHSFNDERLQTALRLIRDHARSGVTAAFVAHQLGLSTRHLSRLCTAHFGCSIHQLIQRERIDQARILLESTSLSLAEVAEMMGYSSVYTFSRAFKNVTGASPGRHQRDTGRR